MTVFVKGAFVRDDSGRILKLNQNIALSGSKATSMVEAQDAKGMTRYRHINSLKPATADEALKAGFKL